MNFVSREQWGARPPTAAYTIIYPLSSTGHWEGPTMGSFPHAACDDKVQGIQAFHMDSNGWSDIAYNGLVCPHGYVFEGRGPTHRSAANGTNPGNDQSYAICYLGGQGDPFTDEAKYGFVDAANWLGQPLTRSHRDWYNTECPGDVINDWIKAGCPLPASPDAPLPESEDDDVPSYTICAADGSNTQYLTDLATFKRTITNEDDWNKTVWCLAASGAKVFQTGVNNPVRVPASLLDELPEPKG